MKTQESIEAAFSRWWRDEGSGMPPHENEDQEEHTKRICKIAWMNGAYVNEALASVAEIEYKNEKEV